MALTVRDLPPILNSSGSSPVTQWVGHISDATSITVYLSTGTNVLSSGVSVEVTALDYGDSTSPQTIALLSSVGYPILAQGSSFLLSSGTGAFTLTNISYNSFRLRTSTNTITTGTTIAFATKQISV